VKTLPSGLQAHLDSGATTLCWCWRLTRRDGVKLGFTDHDRDIAFDGTTFEAAAGFTASEIRESVGLSVDNLEVSSVLSSSRLDEEGLAAGLFDDATVEIFRVNWSSPDQRVLMRKGSLGEVSRSGRSFTAEIRGLAHYLQQPKGRLYQVSCDADLGDARCGVALSAPPLRASGAILAGSSERVLAVAGLTSYELGWFDRGLCTITSGAAAGRSSEVRRHTISGSTATIELWHSLAVAPAASDTLEITAGCDKTLVTCRAKFTNSLNFRGFPHMPGNDFVGSYPRSDHRGSGDAA
jgi:uncharacterized phage protein (TIGR02218 family)